MSWIQENKFVAMLGAATVAGALLIGYFGFSARGKYSGALEDFQNATGQIDGFRSLDLYPEDELIASKRKNLIAYRERIADLQRTFDEFRTKEQAAVSPQEFQDQAKSATEEVIAACAASKTALPEGFFLGFEGYNSELPRAEATAALAYQVGAIKEVLLAVSKHQITQVQNLHRPKSVEEDGRKWEPGEEDTARAFPMEFTLRGSPRAIRQVVSDMLTSQNYYYVIRTTRITNDKNGVAPTRDDARFEQAVPAGGAAPGGGIAPAADPFGGFVLPDEEPEKKPDDDKPADKPKPATGPTTFVPQPETLPVLAQASAVPAVGANRILQQVLGKEEVSVFLRIDVMRFLPATKLPEVPN